MSKPSCYNRPPALDTRLVQDGWLKAEYTAEDFEIHKVRLPRMVTIRDDMSKNCQQWGELGEARLRGWDCAGCRWKEEIEK